jgi:hypothetical protein
MLRTIFEIGDLSLRVFLLLSRVGLQPLEERARSRRFTTIACLLFSPRPPLRSKGVLSPLFMLKSLAKRMIIVY